MTSFFRWVSDKLNAPRARVYLVTEKNEFVIGEEVKGTVNVISEEEFDVEQIWVELSCWENMKKTRMIYDEARHRQTEDQHWEQARLHSDHFQICGAARIPRGFAGKYPFVFRIPTVGRETYHSIDRNVKWWLIATAKVRGRPSIETGNIEILVARLEKPPPPPTVMSKETVREVVLIPCSYCGALMPQMSTFCPYCGARRKG